MVIPPVLPNGVWPPLYINLRRSSFFVEYIPINENVFSL